MSPGNSDLRSEEKRRSEPDGGNALAKTYDALIAAGAPENKAREAAEELAAYENRFAKIEQNLAVLKTDMTAIKWMIGVNLAASISIVIKVFV
jgi:hypothetical protein